MANYEIQRIYAPRHFLRERQTLLQALLTLLVRALEALMRIREKALYRQSLSPPLDNFASCCWLSTDR
ncbi:hypothetical protein [Mesorhizobium sp. LNJC391B00]|uniref:hypothetical protein n=1 Tax=Mesorhizobium sp. LNJC391B00 TaxID=1287273 RepID=UPI0012EBE9DC|nr:hypothetical protein [Mesorhizobium sp. LNJC391B00]